MRTARIQVPFMTSDDAPQDQTRDKNLSFYDRIRLNSWKHTGRLFIGADIFYGMAGLMAANPFQAVAAFSGLATNQFIARHGSNNHQPDTPPPLMERLANPEQHPVDAVSFWNMVRDGIFAGAGMFAALRHGNIQQGISLLGSGFMSGTSNAIILNRHPLAQLGQQIAPETEVPDGQNPIMQGVRGALEHSTNIASIMAYPSVIAMVSAGLTADNMAERVFMLSGAALDLAGITIRSLAPKIGTTQEQIPAAGLAPAAKPVAKTIFKP